MVQVTRPTDSGNEYQKTVVFVGALHVPFGPLGRPERREQIRATELLGARPRRTGPGHGPNRATPGDRQHAPLLRTACQACWMQESTSWVPETVIRRVRPDDQPALRRFYDELTPHTLRARFLGFVPGVSDTTSRSFCTPDHMHGEGFVALMPALEGGELVGHLCLEPANKDQLELAVAVADGHQGQGIGRSLMDAALAWASERHFEAVVATAFADNGRVLRLLSAAPYGAHVLPAGGGVVDVVIPLVPALLADRVVPAPAERRARAHHRPGAPISIRPRCHVVWRRMPPLARAAED